jgi:hypothetical protein
MWSFEATQENQFLISDRDTVRIRRKTLPTTMMALDLDFGPLRQFQNWILADLVGSRLPTPAPLDCPMFCTSDELV